MPVDVLVRALRGIEPMVATEVAERLPAQDLALGQREVRFRLPALADVASLGTADDAFLVLIDGGGADLAGVKRAAATIDLAAVARRLDRHVAAREFDVSASVLGRRRFSRFDVEDAIGGAIRG